MPKHGSAWPPPTTASSASTRQSVPMTWSSSSSGHTPTVLNNLGYHYYLKGDMDSARRSFDAALRADPNNVVAKNNLALFWEPTTDFRRAPARSALSGSPSGVT